MRFFLRVCYEILFCVIGLVVGLALLVPAASAASLETAARRGKPQTSVSTFGVLWRIVMGILFPGKIYGKNKKEQ